MIKDFKGEEYFKIEGKYTQRLIAKDLTTGEEWIIFTAPRKPDDYARMYQWSLYTL